MKKGNFSSLVLLSGALAIPAFAEKVKFQDLPSGLQEKIRSQVGGSAEIQDIDRNTRDGKTIYEVGYKKDGQHNEARFEYSEPAPVISSSSDSSAATSQKIRYEQLPENVRRVAESYVQDAEVNDVDRQVRNGRTTYEIGYKLRDGGAQRELLLSENGEVLNQRTTTTASSSTSTQDSNIQRPARTERGVRWGPGNNNSRASVNARTMQYHELPPNVRSVSDARLSDGHVQKVERIIQNGQIRYDIDFRKEDGRYQELVIAEDGRVIRYNENTGVGSSPSVQSSSSSSTGDQVISSRADQYAHITTPVQLLNPRAIDRSQLPVRVARVVRGQTADANIDEVRRGTWRGEDVYQIGFTDRDNRYVQLQLDANGQVIYDPRRPSGATTGNIINNLNRLFNND
jgi:uncharacterized membrane protein YkoI